MVLYSPMPMVGRAMGLTCRRAAGHTLVPCNTQQQQGWRRGTKATAAERQVERVSTRGQAKLESGPAV